MMQAPKLGNLSQSIAFDEYGQPFIILREQEKQKRLRGKDAHKANILAARSVAQVCLISLRLSGKPGFVLLFFLFGSLVFVVAMFSGSATSGCISARAPC